MASYRVVRCLLLQRLQEKKMTQQELADRVGLSKQQINRYCNNRASISLENAISIALTLGIKVEELFELSLIKHVSERRK